MRDWRLGRGFGDCWSSGCSRVVVGQRCIALASIQSNTTTRTLCSQSGRRSCKRLERLKVILRVLRCNVNKSIAQRGRKCKRQHGKAQLREQLTHGRSSAARPVPDKRCRTMDAYTLRESWNPQRRRCSPSRGRLECVLRETRDIQTLDRRPGRKNSHDPGGRRGARANAGAPIATRTATAGPRAKQSHNRQQARRQDCWPRRPKLRHSAASWILYAAERVTEHADGERDLDSDVLTCHSRRAVAPRAT